MFERFTDRARRIVTLAEDEARKLSHDSVGNQHILLAFVADIDNTGQAGSAFKTLGITYEDVLRQTEVLFGRGDQPSPEHIPLSRAAKHTFTQALQETLRRGTNFIGTEHILLAFVWEVEAHTTESQVLEILTALSLTPEMLRETVLEQFRQLD